MIKIRNLSKKFDHTNVLDNINLDIPDGEQIAFIGPSGCGKSTLLRLLIRLEEPTEGRVEIDGKNIQRLNEEDLVKLRRNIGMVFQSSALFDSLSVGDNVAFSLREHANKDEKEIKEIVARKLAMVELEGTEKLMPAELSGGMQKRVSIARALALDPKIMLYDEPTTGLDPLTSITIEKLINKITPEFHATSIIVTHQLSTVFRTASHIVMLHKGKLIEIGTADDAKSSKNPVVHQFISAGII